MESNRIRSGRIRKQRRLSIAEAQLEAQAVGSGSRTAHPARVHAPKVMPGAQRGAVRGIVGAPGRAENHVVVVQVAIGRAAGYRAAPAIALEDPVGAPDAILRAPSVEHVLQHDVERFASARGPSIWPPRALDAPANRAQDRAKQHRHVARRSEEEPGGLGGGRVLRTCLPVS